ncbi:hypothetical protein CLV59_104244 [Chitinophaga dinghuensis]|uniref:Uncharacterized protein n=2 Tax=Chitinophaga dinghuensis TaxID=1539050 RepID=A0A327VYH7_9BACT|nr:hypothetical protein CLV59_104244 [Chitinophaga dinghuensis]
MTLMLVASCALFANASVKTTPVLLENPPYPYLIYYYDAPFDWTCQLVYVYRSDTKDLVELYAVNPVTQQRTYMEHNVIINNATKTFSLYVDNTDSGNQYVTGTFSSTTGGGSTTWGPAL